MKYQAVRGMHDILPEETLGWAYVEDVIRRLMSGFQYQEIRMPIVESTSLFLGTLGTATDIVEKEMYTFEDRNGDSLTLRPEGTAGCVRAGIQSGILHNQMQRLWYMGPMFRHERPQKGRTRQFHQFGMEAFGMAGPDIDAEIIQVSQTLFKKLGILDSLRLEINTLGMPEERSAYRKALVEHFEAQPELLDEESKERLAKNPMRILDTKNPDLKPVVATAPKLMDYLGEATLAHFERLKQLLTDLGIEFTVNTAIVRGLDYYTHTVFEWITDALGAQGTVCGGGRYDGLVELLGGKSTQGIGFALGMERLIGLLPIEQRTLKAHVCVLPSAESTTGMSLMFANTLRESVPGLRVETLLGGGSLKNLFKRADKSGATFAVVIGEEEKAENTVILKALRDNMEQARWPIDDTLFQFLAQQI
ncbi:MAG: histidine--tRNA ligase [Gammaproteobacteria bacterium]